MDREYHYGCAKDSANWLVVIRIATNCSYSYRTTICSAINTLRCKVDVTYSSIAYYGEEQ